MRAVPTSGWCSRWFWKRTATTASTCKTSSTILTAAATPPCWRSSLSSVIVATIAPSADGDSVTPPANAYSSSAYVENDVPVASGETESPATVQEDDLAVADGDFSDGIDEAGDPPTDEATGSVAALVTSSGRRAGDLHPVGHYGRPAEPDLEGRCGHLCGHRWRRLRHADGHRRCGRCRRAGGVHAGSGRGRRLHGSISKTSSTILTAAATPPAGARPVVGDRGDRLRRREASRRRPMPSSSASKRRPGGVGRDGVGDRAGGATLSTAAGDFSDGIDEAGDPPTDEATGSVAALVTPGAERGATWPSAGGTTAGLPNLTSKGDAVTYAVTDGVGSDTLTATADAGGANERVVFTLVLEEDGDYTFDLQRPARPSSTAAATPPCWRSTCRR